MNIIVSLFLSLVACVCFTDALAQLPVTQKQPAPVTIQKPVTPSKLNTFLTVLQNATSLKEVQNAFNGAGFSRAEVDRVKNQIEATKSLKQKLLGLQSNVLSALEAQRVQDDQKSVSKNIALSAQLNERYVAGYKNSILAIRRSVTTTTDPAVRCQADAPLITNVSPITPGVEFAIQGKGFGEISGTVELITEGKIFNAHVTGWNSCVIYALLDPQISGVRANPQALVSVATSNGKRTRVVAAFSPALEVIFPKKEWRTIEGGFFGCSNDYTFWNFALKNDWYVFNTVLFHRGDGHAEITLAPATNVPNGLRQTKVHAGAAAFGFGHFDVGQVLVGPKGLPYQ